MRDKNTLTVSRCTFNVFLSYAAGANPQDCVAQLESQLKAMELELERATKDLQDAKAINAGLRRDIDGMSDELHKARRQNDELRRDLESSLAYNKKLRAEIEWGIKVKNSMRADIDGMKMHVRNLEAQLKG